ncbi:MAG: class II lanthipeptide, LchA2/BrtA2 family [Paraclostridium sordellii]
MKKNICGEISLEELKALSEQDEVQGGTATPATPYIIEGTIAASVALCPTTKCTSKCRL